GRGSRSRGWGPATVAAVLVVDASALLEVLTVDPGDVRKLAVRLHDAEGMNAPTPLDYEVNVLRELVQRDVIDEEVAEEARTAVRERRLVRHPLTDRLAGRVWGYGTPSRRTTRHTSHWRSSWRFPSSPLTVASPMPPAAWRASRSNATRPADLRRGERLRGPSPGALAVRRASPVQRSYPTDQCCRRISGSAHESREARTGRARRRVRIGSGPEPGRGTPGGCRARPRCGTGAGPAPPPRPPTAPGSRPPPGAPPARRGRATTARGAPCGRAGSPALRRGAARCRGR